MRALLVLIAASICCQAQPVVDAFTNSASYSGRIATGGLATIFGTALADSAVQAGSLPLQTSLGGVTLAIDAYPCPLLYVSATQINFQVPAEIPAGLMDFLLTGPEGQTSGQVQIDEAAPALFQYGTNLDLGVDYTTGAINGPSDPVASGDFLIAYLTGIGPVASPPADGDPANSNPAVDSFSATIGGLDAPVTFLGLVAGLVGLGQANIQVPSLANGNYPLVITVNNVVSTSAVVSVSGTGTVQPNVVTFLSSVGVPTQQSQALLHGNTKVQVNGQYAYVCDPDQITAIDVSNPQAPVAISVFGQSQLNGSGTNCILSNSYLVEVVNGSNLYVWDLLTAPTAPPLVSGPVGLQAGPAGPGAFDGTTLFLDTSLVTADFGTGEIVGEAGRLEAYNFADFTNPILDGVYAPPSNFVPDTTPRYQIAVLSSPYIVTAGTTNSGQDPTTGQGVFDVLDVTDPTNILGVVEVAIPDAVILQDIALQGTEALIQGNTQALSYDSNAGGVLLGGDLTFTLVDFTNPQNPNVLGTVITAISAAHQPYLASLGGGFFAVSNVESYADYSGAAEVAVVDARDASNINVIPVATIAGAAGMYVQGNYLYVATSNGLNVYQIALPPS